MSDIMKETRWPNWEIRKPHPDKEIYEVGFEYEGVWYKDVERDTAFSAGNRLLFLEQGGWMSQDNDASNKVWEEVKQARAEEARRRGM